MSTQKLVGYGADGQGGTRVRDGEQSQACFTPCGRRLCCSRCLLSLMREACDMSARSAATPLPLVRRSLQLCPGYSLQSMQTLRKKITSLKPNICKASQRFYWVAATQTSCLMRVLELLTRFAVGPTRRESREIPRIAILNRAQSSRSKSDDNISWCRFKRHVNPAACCTCLRWCKGRHIISGPRALFEHIGICAVLASNDSGSRIHC